MNFRQGLFFLFACFFYICCKAQEAKLTIEANDSSTFDRRGGVTAKSNFFEFDGSTGFLEFKSDYQLEKSFSISFWINPRLTDHSQTIFLKGEGCPDGNPNFNGLTFQIGLGTDLNLTGVIFSGDGRTLKESLSFQTVSVLLPNQWQFIYVTFDSEKIEWSVYYNGSVFPIQQTFQNSKDSFTNIAPSKNATWKIGAHESYCDYIHSFNDYFSGALRSVKIYDYKRTAEEIDEEINHSLVRAKKAIAITLVIIFLVLVVLLIAQYRYGHERFLARKYITAGILVISLFWLSRPLIRQDNTALFGGDTWEYQSMAVNFSMGLGLQKFGGLATFDSYKFDRFDPNMFDAFQQGAGKVNAYRTPGYAFVLGVVYKIFGIHPLIAKYFQLFLLAIIAGTLPLLGTHLFGRKGYFFGLFGGLLFLYQYGAMANEILTEVVLSFCIYLICWGWVLYWRKSNVVTAALLGGAIGLALLVKGSIIFLPFLTLAYFVLVYLKTREQKTLLLGCTAFVFTFLTILPWSVYASIKSGERVFLSTQTKYIIFDANNELSADGDWHPEWHRGVSPETYLYNSKEFEGRSVISSVILFYSKKPELLIPNYIGKMNRAFSEQPFHQLAIISLLFLVIGRQVKYSNKRGRWPAILFVLLSALCFTTLMADNIYLLSTIGVALVVLKIYRSDSRRAELEAILWLLFINFFILTALTYGNKRFVQVIEFANILLALNYFLMAARELFPRGNRSPGDVEVRP